jgi:ParB/RepB/Spo0J family partition protein
MNAPALPGALATAAFQIVPIEAFAPSNTKTQERRRRRFPAAKLAELAASVRQIGVMQPIVARPHPKPPNAAVKFEIVAGEHRWRAAGQAGLAELNAIIREIPDAELVQFQLTENLQRQTIDPLEEAEGYRELRGAKNLRPEQVAELLGVSRTTVFNRLKLLDLCPEAITALEQGNLTPSTSMLIARIGHHDTQRKVLKEALEGGYEEIRNDKGFRTEVKAPLSYRELRTVIEDDYMVDLKGAPFKLDDEASFGKAGSCAKCPKRTGNQVELFADIKNANVCTDPKCYDDKRQIVFRKAADELRAKGRKIIAGAEAKKVVPRWEEDRSHIAGGFTAMNEKIYSSGTVYGKTPSQILGKGYQPIIIQHPRTGALIEVASQQAIAAAAKGKKPGKDDDEDLPRSVRPKTTAPKVNLPDLDEQVAERLVQLIGDKAPKKFSRGLLVSIAKLVFPEIGGRGDKLELVAKRFGWKSDALSPRYGNSCDFPKGAAGFDEAKIMLLFLYAIWAAGWGPHGHEDVLEFLGIDDDKVREQIIAERKQAQVNARMKAKLAKTSPLVKSKGKKKAGRK